MDDTRTELLPELVELAEDEESIVRLAAFDTIINLMEMMDAGESPGKPVANQSPRGSESSDVVCSDILDLYFNTLSLLKFQFVGCSDI